MQMPKYASSEQTYEALISAAGELAADRGFANVSTRAVAARAGANISSIHYHFGSKEGLFEAVLRRIIAHINEHSYADVLAPFEKELDTPEGQARAVAAVVRRHVSGFFDRNKPRWHSKVMYQALQYDDELCRLVHDEFIEPMTQAIYALLERIRPGMSREDKALCNVLILACPAIHSDYRIPILHSIGAEDFSDEYIERMRVLATRVAQLALGLPEISGDAS